MGYRLGVDIGGTFTDAILIDEETGAFRHQQGLLHAVATRARASSTPRTGSWPRPRPTRPSLRYVVHGTTVATNAIIQRKIARTALITTEGFRDVLEIGRQIRPSLYDIQFAKPVPLVPRPLRFGIPERLDWHGDVLTSRSTRTRSATRRPVARRARRRVGRGLPAARLRQPRPRGSDRGDPRRGVPGRGGLAVVPHRPGVPRVRPGQHRRHQRRASSRSSRSTSARSRTGCASRGVDGRAAGDAERRRRADLRERRRATGVHRRVRARRRRHRDQPPRPQLGPARTRSRSTWAARPPRSGSSAAAQPQITKQYHVGAVAQPGAGAARGSGYPIRTPVIELAEIGAGGGSIAWVDTGGALRVGPVSAGAEPGPAAYGRGGTGADGHRREPRARPAGRRIVPRRRAPPRRRRRHARDPATACADPLGMDVVTAAYGIVEIANAAMASALRLMSVQRGLDPRAFGLVGFGGAGPGPRQPAGGRDGHPQDDRAAQPGHVLGARAAAERPPPRLLADVPAADRDGRRRGDRGAVSRGSRPMGRAMLRREGVADADVGSRSSAEMQYVGQSYVLPIELPHGRPSAATCSRPPRGFHAAHERAYGFAAPAEPTEIVNLRLAAIGRIPPWVPRTLPDAAAHSRAEARSARSTSRRPAASPRPRSTTGRRSSARPAVRARASSRRWTPPPSSTPATGPTWTRGATCSSRRPEERVPDEARRAWASCTRPTRSRSSPTDDEAFATQHDRRHPRRPAGRGGLGRLRPHRDHGRRLPRRGFAAGRGRRPDRLRQHPSGRDVAGRHVRADRRRAARAARRRGAVRRRAHGPARRDGRRGLPRRRRRVHPPGRARSSGRASRSAT